MNKTIEWKEKKTGGKMTDVLTGFKSGSCH